MRWMEENSLCLLLDQEKKDQAIKAVVLEETTITEVEVSIETDAQEDNSPKVN